MSTIKNAALLVDGDIMAYRAAAATDGRQYTVTATDKDGEPFTVTKRYKKDADLTAVEMGGTVELSYVPEPEEHAFHLLKQNMLSLETHLVPVHIETVLSTEVYLTNKGSFRETEIDPTYKMNRADMRRPYNLAGCKQYLMNHWDAKCREGELEADDLLAIRATTLTRDGKNTVVPVICSIDKDLKQVPGYHWDFVKNKLEYVDEHTALFNFYRQLLTGDTSDGIVGIRGIGPKTADKILKNCVDERAMYTVVLKTWLDKTPREQDEPDELYYPRVLDRVRKNANLLYLLREEGKRWRAPE